MLVKHLIVYLQKLPPERKIILHTRKVLGEAVDISTWDDCTEDRHEVWITDYCIDRNNSCTQPDAHRMCESFKK